VRFNLSTARGALGRLGISVMIDRQKDHRSAAGVGNAMPAIAVTKHSSRMGYQFTGLPGVRGQTCVS
jgi:hypothetical protein